MIAETIITQTGFDRSRRLTSWVSRMEAKAAAERVLSPLVPDGTLGWLAFPAHGESVQAFARRAVGVAAARSSWAGGLSDSRAGQ